MRRLSRAVLLLTLLLLAAGQVTAQETDIQKLLARYRKEELANLKTQLAMFRDQAKKGGSGALKRLGPTMKRTADRIKDLSNPKFQYEPSLSVQFNIGEFGQLPDTESPRVVFIVDDDEMIAEYEKHSVDEDRVKRDFYYRYIRPDVDTSSYFGSHFQRTEWERWTREQVHPTGKRLYIKGIPTQKANLGTFKSEQPFRDNLWKYYFEVTAIKEYNGEELPLLQAKN